MPDLTPAPDRDVLHALHVAFDADLPPVPATLHAAALEAFRWRAADDLLAELVFDSAIDGSQLEATVRGTGARRAVRFVAGDLQVGVSIGIADTHISLTPSHAAVPCTVETPEGSRDYVTDGDGSFVADGVAVPLRVRVLLPTGAVATPWIIG